jgi:Fungal trichothecene efflux pump (TRI12)
MFIYRVFWINIPLCVLPMIGLFFTLNLKTDPSSLVEKLARIDYAGILIFSGASCAFLIGITTGGTLYSWASAPVLVPLIFAVALYVAFILYEWKIPAAPMIPLRVFNDRTAAAAFFGAFIHGAVLWCFAYYMIIFVSSLSPSITYTPRVLSSYTRLLIQASSLVPSNMVDSIPPLRPYLAALTQLQRP